MPLRPRFSLRTLTILVTLACAYFGTWELTRTYGVRDVQQRLEESDRYTVSISTPAPFIVLTEQVDAPKTMVDIFSPSIRTDVSLVSPLSPDFPEGILGACFVNRYSYLWFFGRVHSL